MSEEQSDRAGRRRMLLPGLVAAAVLAVIATGALVVRDDAGSPPAGGSGKGAAPSDGRVPSVFGYAATSAEQLLTDQGLEVTLRPAHTCLTPGRADRTRPAAGTPVEPGDRVTLFVTEPSPTASCVKDPPDWPVWRLLDFANERGTAPAFADEVAVYANGRRTTLTGDEAADRESWGADSALDLLVAAAREEMRGQRTVMTPTLAFGHDDGNDLGCGGMGIPDELVARRSLWFGISIPTDAVIGPCTTARVYETDGAIDAVAVRSFGVADESAQPEPEPDPDGVGARFLAFARGETDDLPVDVAVRLYLGNEYQKTLTAEEARDPGAWDVCAAYAERSCPLSALTTLREYDGRPAVTDFIPGCVDKLADAPTDTGGPRIVVFSVPEPKTCADAFAVQIWSNDVAQITAVNLLLGSP